MHLLQLQLRKQADHILPAQCLSSTQFHVLFGLISFRDLNSQPLNPDVSFHTKPIQVGIVFPFGSNL